MSIYNELKMKILYSGSRVNIFIAINVVVYILIGFIGIIEYLFTRQSTISAIITNYLAVPTNLQTLLYRFWTPFTYMFMHAGFLHILFNMLWLFWMGQIFENFLSSKKLTFVYIAGGLAGAVFYIICYNLFPAYADVKTISVAMGASASVTAILVATATLVPDYSIFLLLIGQIRLKWIAIIYIVIDILSLSGGNAGGYLTHIGGAIFGFVFIKALQNGNDWSKPFENLFKPKPKLKVVSKNQNPVYKRNTDIPNQATIDSILDKISTSGYENLTAAEKETLFNASKSNEEKER